MGHFAVIDSGLMYIPVTWLIPTFGTSKCHIWLREFPGSIFPTDRAVAVAQWMECQPAIMITGRSQVQFLLGVGFFFFFYL